jgi:Trypsin
MPLREGGLLHDHRQSAQSGGSGKGDKSREWGHMSRRLCVLLVAAVAMVLAAAQPGVAIVGGQFDGNLHPNVALVLVDGQPICTGFLYRTDPSQTTSNLVATAGHCTSGETGQFSVTFDPTPNLTSTFYTGTAYTDPDFVPQGKFNNSLQQFATDDLGVIVLDQVVAGVVPADLPSVGQVDTLDLKTQSFTVVGYGSEGFHPANTQLGGGRRMFAVVPATPGQRSQTGDQFLRLDGKQSGSCFGDSGGPNFLGSSTTAVGVTSWGQSFVCSDHGYVYRIDNPDALAFLNNPTAIGVPS